MLDEPRPGGLSRFAVNPLWPLLAMMFGGAWLALPWFALNGFAVGSPNRFRETALGAGGLAGSLALALAIGAADSRGALSETAIRFAVLGVVVWKLAVAYWLYALQSRSFGLYEYYGGPVRNGALVAILGGILGRGIVLGGAKGLLPLVLG